MASSDEGTEKQVKDFIKSIVTSNPLLSTIQSVQKDYKEFIGSSIPYHKFKYNSVEHFLKSIPDVCVVQGTGPFAKVTPIPSEKSAHINEMVTRQKVNIKGRRCLQPRRRSMKVVGYGNSNSNRKPPRFAPSNNYAISPYSGSDSGSSFDYMGSKDLNTSQTIQNSAVNQNSDAGVRIGMQNLSFSNKNAPSKTTNNQDSQNYSSSRMENEQPRSVSKISNYSPQTNQENKTLNNFNIPDNAPNLDKNDLRYLGLGNKDVRESPKETRSTDEDFTKSKEKTNNILHDFKSVCDNENEDTSNVPRKVQNNLRSLIGQFSNGIWCSDLLRHYKELYHKDLMYMEYGYTSLIEMCVALKHIFHYVRPGRDDFKLYDRTKPLPESVEKLYTLASYGAGEKVSNDRALPELEWSDFQGYIPKDVFEYGNVIQTEFVPKDTKVEAILDVVVVEIYDPSKFWVYLGTSENNSPLDDLMDQLQDFYNQPENAKEYAIPVGALKEGLYCVQVIYGEYHRAKIVRVFPDCPDFVRVLYIDYGTVCKVPVKGICFLHSKFAGLNAQAIRCRLANIVPQLKGHPWPRTTTERFRQLVNRRDTKIKISYINWNEEYLCVFLADITDSSNVLYINEILVREEHALWEGEKQVDPFVLSNFKCKVHNLHLFPTFLELEYGLAPNASEMYTLEEMLVPLHFCIPQYFSNDQITDSDDDDNYDEGFIETVKNRRKCTPLNEVDVSTLLNPPSIDFDLFGDLKDDMMEFIKTIDVEGSVQKNETNLKQEDELFCDIEEVFEKQSLLDSCGPPRKLDEYAHIRLVKEDKELSENIIKKLERYCLLKSETSDSDTSKLISDESEAETPLKCETLDVNLRDDWSPGETAELELSTIIERSGELDLQTSDTDSPKQGLFGYPWNNGQANSDINIFDNPEAFENASNTSEKSENQEPVTPESFLRTVEMICKRDLEDSEVLEEITSTTADSPSEYIEPENPFKFDINADLKEAFKTFLQSQKKTVNTPNLTSHSSCEQSPNVSQISEEPILALSEDGDTCVRSFLTCGNTKNVANNSFNEKSFFKVENKEIRGYKSDSHIPSKTKPDESQKALTRTLSQNNPFRSYLENHSSETNDNGSSVGSVEDDTTTTVLANSESSSSSTLNLLRIDSYLKDTGVETMSTKTSDSEGSDYKGFVPRSSSSRTSHVSDQDSKQSRTQDPAVARGYCTSPSVETPPRLFTPPGCYVPPGYVPWSNGGGFTVPQYPQWSNGSNYPPPYPSYLNQRGNMRPPPGFMSYQNPPQCNPYLNYRMGPPMMYTPPYPGPIVNPPRQQVPPPFFSSNVPDFYETYNKKILGQSQNTS